MSCNVCKESLKEVWAYQTEDQLLFHLECFRCVDCGKDLASVGIGSASDTRCVNCQRQVEIIRRGCEKPIKSDHKRVGSDAYHMDCMVCNRCSRQFADEVKTCYPIEGKLFCLECHYDQRSANYLRDASKPIKTKKTKKAKMLVQE